MAERSKRIGARVLGAGLVAVAVSLLPGSPGTAQVGSGTTLPASGLMEVDRLPISDNDGAWGASGWLVLNPQTRRAYQVFEASGRTIVESFDLDSLAPRRRLTLTGVPVPTGRYDAHLTTGGTSRSAEVVHAVDREAGILYLALSDLNAVGQRIATDSNSQDARRGISRYVAIDERALDEGREAVASFREPAAQSHLRLYWLHGMEVDRSRTATTPQGRQVGTLVLLFAQPNHVDVPGHNHELVRWDSSRRLTPSATARNAVDPTATADARDDGRRILEPCQRASLTAPQGGYNTSGSGSQWGMLVRREEIALVCHLGSNAAAVVVFGLQDDGGFPAAGAATVHPLGRGAYDAVADGEGGRLLLRTTDHSGETWWVFDAGIRRYTGSLAAKISNNGSMTTGLDPSTGRFYALLADYNVNFAGGLRSVRGGLMFADTALFDPVPFENARPELAYPAFAGIRVDPLTRRVFVRRGRSGPACTPYPRTPSVDACPLERFYRVFEDRVPVPAEPAEADDAAFTTDVAEAEGITRASYLGTGSGYGVRAMVVGGLVEATVVGTTSGFAAHSGCGKDDRQLLSGSAGPVSVSDLSAAAVAASLDADAGTRAVMASPVTSCWPPEFAKNGFRAPADDNELSFDRRRNQHPYAPTPDGANDYEAACVGQGGNEPPEVEGRLSRRGFTSEVGCDQAGARAHGQATGSLAPEEVLPRRDDRPPSTLGPEATAQWNSALGQYNALAGAFSGLRVAKGHSEVKVTRKLGTGIVTTVDSWARGVVVPGVGEIGAVRGEATVQAAGRPGTAKARFERTICDVDFGGFQHLGCLDLEKDDVVRRLNEAAAGIAEFRVRNVDPKLEKGSRSGFRAAVQRDRLDRFGDRIIARDESLAVPALEIVLHRNAGRQVLHLAAAEASVSYGIACLYGQRPDATCALPDDSFGPPDGPEATLGPDGEVITVYQEVDGEGGGGSNLAAQGGGSSGSKEPRIVRLIRRIPRLVADALRLIFNNPREFGLMAAVWALLYAPCYLGERRRSIRALRARREVVVQRA